MMGVMVGNVLGLLILGVALGFGYESVEKASLIFLAVAYGLWIIFWIVDLTGRPASDTPFCKALDESELKLYRNYHTAIDFPLAGQVYSGILNLLRVAGLVYSGLCLWKGFYPEAAGSLLFFILSASLIHRNTPWMFLSQMAKKGHPRAVMELQGLEGLMRRQQDSSTDAVGNGDDGDT